MKSCVGWPTMPVAGVDVDAVASLALDGIMGTGQTMRKHIDTNLGILY